VTSLSGLVYRLAFRNLIRAGTNYGSYLTLAASARAVRIADALRTGKSGQND
jgi:hypothetical protein